MSEQEVMLHMADKPKSTKWSKVLPQVKHVPERQSAGVQSAMVVAVALGAFLWLGILILSLILFT